MRRLHLRISTGSRWQRYILILVAIPVLQDWYMVSGQILIEILKQSPNPCLECLMLGISYHTYHTLREVHASWNDFKLFVKNLKARQKEGQTLTADELDHIQRYKGLKHLKPGKRTQHPQLSSQSKQVCPLSLSFRLEFMRLESQDLRSHFSM